MVEFKKLSEVDKVETASENASVLIEDGGEIKRAPKSEVGGRGGSVAVITTSAYDDYIAGVSRTASLAITYSCKNMTFKEAKSALLNGESLDIKLYDSANMPTPFASSGTQRTMTGSAAVPLVIAYNADIDGIIIVMFKTASDDTGDFILYWTVDGISTDAPFIDE